MMPESKKPAKPPKGTSRVAGEGRSTRSLRGSQGKVERTLSGGGSAPPTVKDVLKPRGGDKKEKK